MQFSSSVAETGDKKTISSSVGDKMRVSSSVAETGADIRFPLKAELTAASLDYVSSYVDCDASDLKFETFKPESRDTDDGERRMVIPR
jgi:hypothetical protein